MRTEDVQNRQETPATDSDLVTLHFLEEVSKSDLARRLGVYPSTVGRQLGSAGFWTGCPRSQSDQRGAPDSGR